MEQDTRRSIRSHLRIRLQDHNPNADFKREQARKAVRRNREQHTEEQKVIVRNLDRDRSKKRRAMMSEEEKEKVRAQTRIRQQRYMANKRSLAAAATKAGVLPKTSIRAPVYMTRNEQQEIHAKLATTRLMCLKRQRRCRAKWSAQKKRRINEKRRQKYRDKKEAERLRKSGQGAYQFTAEEKQVLKDCGRESFWYRCVPLSACLCAGVAVLTRRGILKPSPFYGNWLKYVGVSFVGYSAGKFSYAEKCRQMLMGLEGSPLAEAIRKGQRGPEYLQELYGRGRDRSDSAAETTTEQPDKLREYKDQDIDTDKNIQNQGLSDSFRPSVDSHSHAGAQSDKAARTTTSYDDLRRANRGIYDKQMGNFQPRQTNPQPPNQPGQQSPKSTDQYGSSSGRAEGSTKGVKKNKYGDIIEE